MTDLQDSIRDVYRQVGAPAWEPLDLDGLAGVLRDLSWLPEGEVTVRIPTGEDPRFKAVLRQAVTDTAAGPRPVRVVH